MKNFISLVEYNTMSRNYEEYQEQIEKWGFACLPGKCKFELCGYDRSCKYCGTTDNDYELIGTDYKEELENCMKPQPFARLIDLLSDDAIRSVDCQVFWQDTSGNLIPISIPWNSQINIKLAFLKKRLYRHLTPSDMEETERREDNRMLKRMGY